MNGRRKFQPKDMLSFGPFSLLVAGRLLKRADEPIPLGGRALGVLVAQTQRAGEVVSYSELISVARPNVTVNEANLRVELANPRKALGDGEGGVRYPSSLAVVLSRPSHARQGRRIRPKETLTGGDPESTCRD
jgi:DNA-binding response OmpR family regulator